MAQHRVDNPLPGHDFPASWAKAHFPFDHGMQDVLETAEKSNDNADRFSYARWCIANDLEEIER